MPYDIVKLVSERALNLAENIFGAQLQPRGKTLN